LLGGVLSMVIPIPKIKAWIWHGCRPEFLNRLDEIIVFRQLTKSEVKQIADIMLKEVFTRAEGKGIKIDVTERFKVRSLVLCLVCCFRPLLHNACSCVFQLQIPLLIRNWGVNLCWANHYALLWKEDRDTCVAGV
jgi:hypothetical protein